MICLREKDKIKRKTGDALKADKKRFYGRIQLDPLTSKLGFSTVFDEVVQLFTVDPSVAMNISVEITATGTRGFDEQKQRAVKENCRTLQFDTYEFEE